MTTKIEKFLFYFLIFSLPFQRRAIIYSFGTEFNEWNSAFLYFTDILIGGILILWLIRPALKSGTDARTFTFGERFRATSKIDLCLFILLSLAGLSLFSAQNKWLALYQIIKLIEFSCLFFYIKSNFQQLFNLKIFLKILIASGLLQSAIAILQFLGQKNLNLYIFEESIVGPQLPGVAKIDILSSETAMPAFEIMRAYGTFPHANPLAVFLAVCLLGLAILYSLKKAEKFSKKLFYILSSLFIIFALCLTFSRTIIILTIAAIFIYLICSRRKFLAVFFIINFILSGLLLYPEFSSRFNLSTIIDSQAVTFRIFYNQIALDMTKANPFFGIGAGNFVTQMRNFIKNADLDLIKSAIVKDGYGSWIFQPVHNVFLLIASELGLFALLFFILFLFLVFKRAIFNAQNLKSKIWFLVFGFWFLVLFFIDHYFWTLQQGSLLLWIGIAIAQLTISNYSNKLET